MERRSFRRLGARTLLSCLALSVAFVAAAAEPRPVPIAIIVSADWESLSQVSVRQLRRIYLRTSKGFAGVKFEPVDHPPDSSIYRAFLKQVVKKPRKVLADYWLEQILTGGLRPPRQMKDSGRVIDFVARTPGAIAYVRLDDLVEAGNPGVKILSLSQREGAMKPSQPDYALSFPSR